MAKKVLLIDDEEEFTTTLAERLTLRGFDVKYAFDGEGGLMELEQWQPDIVILDILMPGISGTEVLKRIKRQFPELPVILLSGHGSVRDAIEGMKYGAVDFLMKPVDITELTAKIQHYLHQKNSQETP
ncbi:MAG: response regulator [Thermodesulforhabdaceae bacterium]